MHSEKTGLYSPRDPNCSTIEIEKLQERRIWIPNIVFLSTCNMLSTIKVFQVSRTRYACSHEYKQICAHKILTYMYRHKIKSNKHYVYINPCINMYISIPYTNDTKQKIKRGKEKQMKVLVCVPCVLVSSIVMLL